MTQAGKSSRCLLVVLLTLLPSLAHALPDCSTSGIVVPAGFTVKRCWTAGARGIDRPVGALRFNGAGDTLYVIGDAGTSTSKIHLIPVTRAGGPGTEVTDLLTQMGSPIPAASPSSASGLDAGLEIGPTPSGTTVFVTYFGSDSNFDAITTLGERPGGISGAETKFVLRNPPTNLFQSPSGLTFSPFRTDPGTGLGRLQVSTAFGSMVWEIALTPSGTPGLYTPGAKEEFVSVFPGGMEAIQYVPAGQFFGDLMYATRDDVTIRRLNIDPLTGLPVNTAGNPELGTKAPQDFLFASGFSRGPIGLEFDAKTNDDLFVTTFDEPGTSGEIYQIGGFTLTTTTSTSTSTTTTTVRCGDVNGNGVLNVQDAQIVAQYDVLLLSCGEAPFSHPEACDITGNQACNIGDAQLIAQCDVGLPCPVTCGTFTCPPAPARAGAVTLR